MGYRPEASLRRRHPFQEFHNSFHFFFFGWTNQCWAPERDKQPINLKDNSMKFMIVKNEWSWKNKWMSASGREFNQSLQWNGKVGWMNGWAEADGPHAQVEAQLIDQREINGAFAVAQPLIKELFGYAAAGKKRKNQQLFHPFNFMELNWWLELIEWRRYYNSMLKVIWKVKLRN